MTIEAITKAEQVRRQYLTVARLARVLADVHEDIAPAVEHMNEGVLDRMGYRSAHIMETLGDILNGMDAATEEESDLDQIFEMAQAIFPVNRDY